MSVRLNKIRIALAVSFLVIFSACGSAREIAGDEKPLVNSSHLDSLYEEISVNGRQMGIIHIYSDYPEYKWISDDDEGAACVDDAARAAVFYLNDFRFNSDSAALLKAEHLLEFLLFMQSDNGFFYNFIFDDHSINKTHKNSVNQASWWSWRAMWALSEGNTILKNINQELSRRITVSLQISLTALAPLFTGEHKTTDVDGVEVPEWLPDGSASDQAAVLLLALVNMYEQTKDSSITEYAGKLCSGILLMQKGDAGELPYGAILSWRNVWHAYGSSQSYALLKASEILERKDIRNAALKEINYFYDYLISRNFLSSFSIVKDSGTYTFTEENRFSQIAYGIRPMIFAGLKAFSITRDSMYILKAAKIAGWFFGGNPAGAQMYNPADGICYDGINSENGINLNSGAESTIEALLSMQMLEHYGLTKKQIMIFRSE